MKKSLFLMGAALVAFASCTESTVEEMGQYKAIKFSNPYTENVTKAVDDVATSDLASNAYYVFGYYGTPSVEVFNNTKVNNGTTPEVTAYWTENAYQFAAYADGKSGEKFANASFAPATKTLTISNYTVGTKDLVAAVVAADINGTGRTAAVDLAFGHLLSKVKFTLTNGETADYKMNIKNLTIAEIPNAGNATVTPAATSWEASNSSKAAVVYSDLANVVGQTAGETEEFYVIPQTLASIAVSFTAEMLDANGAVIKTKPYNGTVTNVTWKPGYAYNYTATVSVDKNTITFSATVAPWGNDGGGAITF